MFAFADTDGDGSLSFQEFEVTIIIEEFENIKRPKTLGRWGWEGGIMMFTRN